MVGEPDRLALERAYLDGALPRSGGKYRGSRRTTPRWWVVCDSFRSGPFRSRDAALAHVREVRRIGVCLLDHRVVEEAP